MAKTYYEIIKENIISYMKSAERKEDEKKRRSTIPIL